MLRHHVEIDDLGAAEAFRELAEAPRPRTYEDDVPDRRPASPRDQVSPFPAQLVGQPFPVAAAGTLPQLAADRFELSLRQLPNLEVKRRQGPPARATTPSAGRRR